MKIKFLPILIVFSISVAFAGALITNMLVRVEGENVVVEWWTDNETNVKYFGIQRRTPQTDFIELDKISAGKSDNHYVYIDKNIYKTEDLLVIYRIAIVDNDNSVTYSKEYNARPMVSGFKKTWGSIKAMFR